MVAGPEQSNKSILLQWGKGPWGTLEKHRHTGRPMAWDCDDCGPQRPACCNTFSNCLNTEPPVCCVLWVLCQHGPPGKGTCKHTVLNMFLHVLLLSRISELRLGHFPPVVPFTWLLNPFSRRAVWAQHFHDSPGPGVRRHTERMCECPCSDWEGSARFF